MPWQLIYTSAPRGLLSGQSGFCTVARSGDVREALVQRLEQLSSYHYLRVAEAATASRNPTVCAFRILDLRGTKYHVLTRIQPCGLDFTARTNHLAHHLVFQADELSQLPSPAAILRHWNGWLSSWQGEPRLLEDPSLAAFNSAAKSCLPAQTWLRVTGDAGRAAGLLESECIRGCYLVCPPGSEGQVLEMFCETLQLLNLTGQYALRPWRHPFTTFLQAEDNPADFQWRACQEGTPAYQQAVQRTTGLIPLRSVRVPNNSLVKVAREGQKPPAPPAASSTQTSLALRQRAPGKRLPGTEMTDTGHWRNPELRPEKPSFLDINFSINSGSLARIGIFAAVLLILLLIRIKMNKPPVLQEAAPETAPVQAVSAPTDRYGRMPAPTATEPSFNQPRVPLDPAQLDSLSGDGPTYVFTTPNMIYFDLPIDSIGRFQNLIQRFDHLETRPNDIQLSLNTDKWDFTTGATLAVNGRQTETLSAKTAGGLECSFDYSNWKNNSNNPVAVHAAFSTPPNSFSVHFGFSIPTNGDPFRLLIVNESNAPVPLHLGMQWLKTNCDSVAASLHEPLGERLFGNFILPPGRSWRLLPFIRTRGAPQARYLYQDWPAEELPAAGNELDFARVKEILMAQQIPLHKKADLQAKKLEQQKEQAALDLPLGKYLGLTNANLASFSTFADRCSSGEFIEYLNSLKKHLENGRWPRLFKEDDEATLSGKFQTIYDCCIELKPTLQAKLMIDNNNYFSVVWLRLKEIEKSRQALQQDRNEVDKLRTRLNSVPGTLDKVAYVGLFIIDPPKPGLEMIRFQGP